MKVRNLSRPYKKIFALNIVVITTLVTLVFATTFCIFAGVLNGKNTKATLSLMEGSCASFDDALVDVLKNCASVFGGQAVTKALTSSLPLDELEAVAEMKSLCSVNNVFESVAVIPANKANNTLTDTGSFDTEYYFSKLLNYPGITTSQQDKQAMRLFSSAHPLSPSSIYLGVSTRMPMSSPNSRHIAVALINRYTVKRYFQTVLNQYGGYIDVVQDNRCVLSLHDVKDEPRPQEYDYSQLSFQQPRRTDIDGKRYVSYQVPSKFPTLSYAFLIPYNNYYHQTNVIVFSFIMVMIILLTLSVFISFYILSFNYKPIQDLIESIDKNKSGTADESERDIFSLLDNYLSAISLRSDSLNTSNIQQAIVKCHVIKDLLYREGQLYNDPAICEAVFPVKMNKQNFCIISIKLFDTQYNPKTSDAELHHICYGIINVLEELGNKDHICYAATTDDKKQIVAIFNSSSRQERLLYDIEEICVHTQRIFFDSFALEMGVGVSSVASGLFSLNQLMQEAQHGVAHLFVRHKTDIVFHDESFCVAHERIDHGYMLLYNRVVADIKNVDMELVANDIEQLFCEISERPISIATVKSICHNISIRIISNIIAVCEQFDLTYNSPQVRYVLDGQYDNLAELKLSLLSLIFEVLSNIGLESDGKELYNKLVVYAKENYCNSMLTLELISDKFNQTSSHLTTYFKQCSGQSLMKYIDNLRMEKAKQLLRDTDDTIKSIIAQTGYVDYANFNRKFRTQNDLTPVEYRKSCRKAAKQQTL